MIRTFRVSLSYQNPIRARFPSEFFASLPRVPGVYFMRCPEGRVLYVGKAKCLRTRLKTYRSARPGSVGENIVELLERVASIDWEEHDSELSASERERELIRAMLPRFNVADAWEEDYFFIGLRQTRPDRLEFRLTSRESDREEFELHGCFAHRTRARSGYSALLRLLFAAECDRSRFAFPSRIARSTPAYTYTLKLREAPHWKALVTDFLRGRSTALLDGLVQALLANERIPPFVRAGLQEDLELLQAFERACLRRRANRPKPGLRTGIVSQKRMRQSILRSVRRQG
jgi:excinuclease UvrABC nuclease subunit